MESENIKYCWDEFGDYCQDHGVRVVEGNEHRWEPLWEIWRAAIDAKLAYQELARKG
jgi:hypothetical protein